MASKYGTTDSGEIYDDDGHGDTIIAKPKPTDLHGESGSHVDTKGISMNLGFTKEVENKSGKLLFAPFIEYGHGSYDSYQENGMSADGKANWTF